MTSKHSKSLLAVLSLLTLAVLTVLVLEIYYIWFKNMEISELMSLADHDTEMKILDQSIERYKNNAMEDINAFENSTLSSNRLVPLIESVEKMGQVLDLETHIVSVDKIKDTKSNEPDKIRIVMETQGSWTPTFNFLHAIESLPNRVMIDEASLSKEEDSWRMKIILSLYSFN